MSIKYIRIQIYLKGVGTNVAIVDYEHKFPIPIITIIATNNSRLNGIILGIWKNSKPDTENGPRRAWQR